MILPPSSFTGLPSSSLRILYVVFDQIDRSASSTKACLSSLDILVTSAEAKTFQLSFDRLQPKPLLIEPDSVSTLFSTWALISPAWISSSALAVVLISSSFALRSSVSWATSALISLAVCWIKDLYCAPVLSVSVINWVILLPKSVVALVIAWVDSFTWFDNFCNEV